MIILAIILVLICVTKLCLLGSRNSNIEADCDSFPVSKETLTSLAKGIMILESLVGIFCGLFIIFAL